jgi:tetratricopeptide (TPR) repeat protein
MRPTGLLILLIGILITFGIVFSADSRSLFEEGNKYFQAEDYKKAIDSYTQILNQGLESPEVYFNLGNAYYKAGESAMAILNYERALKLRPRDQDIQTNLNLANRTIVDRVEPPPMLFFWRWMNAIRDNMTANEWGKWCIITLWIAVVGIALAVFRRRGLLQQPIRYLAGVLIVIWIIFFAGYLWKSHYDHNTVQAIVTTQKVEVLSAPDETGTVLFDLHEGIKINVLRNVPGWSEISLPDPQKRGWLPQDTMEII